MAGDVWFKLSVTWADSEWVDALEPAARLAWVHLIGHVKANGYGGKVKAIPESRFAGRYNLPIEAVQAMLAAAVKDHALVMEGGRWAIANWDNYQGDSGAAERMRRMREKKSAPDVTEVTRNGRHVTTEQSRAEQNRTEVGSAREAGASPKPNRKRTHVTPEALTAWTPGSEHAELADARGVDLSDEADRFRDYALNRREPYRDLDAAFRNWLRNAQGFARPARNGAGHESATLSDAWG